MPLSIYSCKNHYPVGLIDGRLAQVAENNQIVLNKVAENDQIVLKNIAENNPTWFYDSIHFFKD